MTAETEAANAEQPEEWFASAKKIYPMSVHGKFRTIKWAILFVTLGLYYFLPFIRYDRGPDAPGQALLIDLEGRRAYFFFIEIWPQEVYYLTGLLILAAVGLFLMNAVAGRVWCGYLCPQTVWTDLFLWVERKLEGDRRERIALANAPWSVNKIARRSLKHFFWLMIAWWTGGAWVQSWLLPHMPRQDICSRFSYYPFPSFSCSIAFHSLQLCNRKSNYRLLETDGYH